jgi:hypothetical protein
VSDQHEDVELEALQRQLDDAFSTVRPRAEFSDDLWLRMQAKRPFWEKVSDAWSALWTGFRAAPSVPAAAVAVVIVIAIGATLVTLNGRNGLQQSTSQQSSAKYAAGGSQALSSAPGPFGRLPTPSLSSSGARMTPAPPANGGGSMPGESSGSYYFTGPSGNFYFGPANLTWSGTLPSAPATSPVYRYMEPGSAEAGTFAAGLGAASPQDGKTGAGILGTYRGNALTVTVHGSTLSPAQEPFFYLTPDAGAGQAGGEQEIAAAFLSAHGLAPTWTNTVTLNIGDYTSTVHYLHQFQAGNSGFAYLVDSLGERYGLDVVVQNGRVVLAAGPVPVKIETADYQIVTPATSIRAALSGSTSSPGNPMVKLTSAELVYALAVSNGQGFYEPCYLFSGAFQLNGITYVKRVLVPAIASR